MLCREELHVGLRVWDTRCATCDPAVIVRVSDGQAVIQYSDGTLNRADPEHLTLVN